MLLGYSSTVAWGILTRPRVGDFQVAIRVQNAELMTEAQRRYLFRILAEQGIEGDAAFEKLKSIFDVNALKQVSKRDASRVIEQLLEDQGG